MLVGRLALGGVDVPVAVRPADLVLVLGRARGSGGPGPAGRSAPPASSVWMNAGSPIRRKASPSSAPRTAAGSSAADGKTFRQPGGDRAEEVVARGRVALDEPVVVAAGDVPRHLQALGRERASARARAARDSAGTRRTGRRARRVVRVPEAAVAVGRDAAVVVVVGDAGVQAGGDRGVERGDRRPASRRARVGRADRLAGERVDRPAVEHGLEPARLVELLVVGQVAGGDRRSRASPACRSPSRDLARAVGVDVADRLVEDLQARTPPAGATTRLISPPARSRKSTRAGDISSAICGSVSWPKNASDRRVCVPVLGGAAPTDAARIPWSSPGARSQGDDSPEPDAAGSSRRWSTSRPGSARATGASEQAARARAPRTAERRTWARCLVLSRDEPPPAPRAARHPPRPRRRPR